MAIVERPLAAVIAAPRFPTPTSLSGQTVGITGVPSDTAVLHSIVAGAGGDPARLRTITIGFNAVPDLLAGRVAAATAFWNDEGVTLERRHGGRALHDFRVDDYGAPRYPELVVCATRRRCATTARSRSRLVQTLVDGYGVHAQPPEPAAPPTSSRSCRGLTHALVSAQLTALLPAFPGLGGRVGVLDPADAAQLGGLGGAIRDRPQAAGRGHRFRPEPRRLGASRSQAESRSSSAGPSRAIRERGTTSSNPASSRLRPHIGLDVRDRRRAPAPRPDGARRRARSAPAHPR